MQNDYKYCIGLMSGTSLDGIDLVYIKMNSEVYKDFEILNAETISYSKEWLLKLQEAISYSKKDLLILDIEYGQFLGSVLVRFINKNKINKIDFIASHGHTILHQPQNGITLQIGSGQEIAKATNTKVICDFRTQDVKLGGQGAPLVPVGDKLLFSKYDYCINLGGFANISYEQNNSRIAFDVCPVNIVLNHYTRKIGLDYDDSGKISSEGKINIDLLNQLNSLSYYKEKFPKSLGLEWVQKNIFPLIDRTETDTPVILRTFVEHIATQIAIILKENTSVLITGGGVFNTFLINRIETLSKIKIPFVNKELIEYKEALIFAFLGLLRVDNQVNCLKSVTGAKKDHSSGVIFYP